VLHAYSDREPDDPPGKVTVSAYERDAFLHLDIEDDGSGMRARSDSPGIGVGLVVISRLAAVCTIETPPKRAAGCLVHLEFPLRT
jgi:two-component sensor histidine kinase